MTQSPARLPITGPARGGAGEGPEGLQEQGLLLGDAVDEDVLLLVGDQGGRQPPGVPELEGESGGQCG